VDNTVEKDVDNPKFRGVENFWSLRTIKSQILVRVP
jgi:hypothetical protein